VNGRLALTGRNRTYAVVGDFLAPVRLSVGWNEVLVKVTEGFNGAEIEQAVNGAMIEAFNSGRSINEQDLVIAAGNTVPLSTTMREEIGRMERWAYNRAIPASK